MRQYKCNVCGYIYVPEEGDSELEIAPGTPFEAIDESWVCPLCGSKKPDFSPLPDGEASLPGAEMQA